MSATAHFIPADDLQELHVARAMFGVFAKTARAVASAHRGKFETTGCIISLAEAWKFDEEAAEHEAIVAEAEAVLKIVEGTP
jgi:hypothetical protein